MTMLRSTRVAIASLSLLLAAPAFGQATRTWVSGVGDDANPCSRTAPCKTFAGAISKTAAGGEIDALDPGGYGAVTITKAITLDGAGVLASILVGGTNGVVVSAAVTDRIVIRNLSFNGLGTGLMGIRVQSAGAVHVDGCSIEGFTVAGIGAVANTDLLLTVRNTTIRSAGTGVQVAPVSPKTARVLLDHVGLESNTVGLGATANALVAVRGSEAADNDDAGVLADATGGTTEVSLADVTLAHNATGVRATGGAVVRLTRAAVVSNTTAGLVEAGGTIVPFVESQVDGNPAGPASACGLASLGSAAVACPASCPDVTVPACPDVTVPACPEVPACPTPVCPTPVCDAPVMTSHMGPCKRCKTRGGVTTCVGCAIDAQP